MANDITKSPIYLDTVGMVWTHKCLARAIRWVGATTAGHKCIIIDNDGRIVWGSEASGANFIDADRPEEVWNGLHVDTLDSGYVLITL